MSAQRTRGVAIAGVAESELGVTGRSLLGLLAEAATGALADAGLRLTDVDGLATNAAARFSTAQVAEYLGLRPTWTDSTFAGGASYELFVGHALRAIEAGDAETVLVCYGSNQRSARSRSLAGVVEQHTPDAQFQAPIGALYPISLYAMAAQRYLETYAAKPEQLAEVAVAAREWALLNPKAYRYGAGPLSVDEVLASPLLSSPLHQHDCCLVTDGGGAVVLTTLERARHLARTPVSVLGYGECTTGTSMAGVPDLLRTDAAVSGARAFAAAGVTPHEIDVVQLYDSFTITVLLSLEALGFCGYGEAADFVGGGRIAPGGSFPLDTSGGGLSYTHPGMFGIFLLIEAVRQLRGDAGERQVPRRGASSSGSAPALPELACCHGTGGILSTHSTVVLGAAR